MGSISRQGVGATSDAAMLDALTDDQLTARAEAGNDAAISALIERHRATLVGKTERLVSSHIAEEVVQQTVTKLYVAFKSGQEIRSPGAWMHRVAHNMALDHLRSASHRHEDHAPLDTACTVSLAAGPQADVEARQQLDEIVGAIGQLPDRERQVLVESTVSGKSNEQLAEELGLTPKNIGVIKHRARARLRKLVGCLIPIPLLRLFGRGPGGSSGGGSAGAAAGAGGSATLKLAALGAAGVAALGAGVALEEHDGNKSDPNRNGRSSPVAGSSVTAKKVAATSAPHRTRRHARHAVPTPNAQTGDQTSGKATPGAKGPDVNPGSPGTNDPDPHKGADTTSRGKGNPTDPGKGRDHDDPKPETNPVAQPASSVMVSGTTMRILGRSSGADSITVDFNAKNQYVVSEANSPSTFSGGNGCSRSSSQPKNIVCSAASVSKVEVASGDGDDTVKVLNGALPAPIAIDGGPGNDQIVGREEADNVTGGPGDDSISVGDGDNTVSGGDGNDVITSDHGADVVDGGDGADDIRTQSGNDSIEGGGGNDSIIAGLGEDIVAAGAGQDRIQSSDGQRDQLDCGSDIDILGRVDRIDSLIGCEQ